VLLLLLHDRYAIPPAKLLRASVTTETRMRIPKTWQVYQSRVNSSIRH